MLPGSDTQVPDIGSYESFDIVVRKLATYITSAIEGPHDFEELKKVIYPRSLRPLARYLIDDIYHESIVAALLALRWHFSTTEDDDDRGLNETRALACEIVAWRFVSNLTEREAVEYLCYELPAADAKNTNVPRQTVEEPTDDYEAAAAEEDRPLLDGFEESGNSFNDDNHGTDNRLSEDAESFATTFAGLSALEVAAVAGAKKFLSEKPIQRIINGIWKGDIVFWDTLSTNSVKKVRFYNRERSDPFCRLRVPLYLKLFEILFFAGFLAFYYTVLVQKQSESISAAEIMLYIWIASFSYNELGEFWDAGITFYVADFWASWDLGIIAVGIAFFVARMVGIATDNERATDVAFDILSVEALFLVPRICSLLSLHPYFGMLLPALKEMTKDFIKFLGLVAVLYLGFSTTFTFLARGKYTFAKLNWILINVFFGSSYCKLARLQCSKEMTATKVTTNTNEVGFDIAERISPILGPPLMLVFVCMTNILLITSLISLLSNSLTKVMEHARDEYLFGYSVYVLEAATSNRLTYFLPPLNLLPLLLRPLRLVLDAETLRAARIVLLKATSWPFVAVVLGYESWRLHLERRTDKRSTSLYVRGPNSPSTIRRRPVSGRWTQRPLVATGTRGISLAGQARTARTPVTAPVSAPMETHDNLETAVEKLKCQIEEISNMIAKGKIANASET